MVTVETPVGHRDVHDVCLLHLRIPLHFLYLHRTAFRIVPLDIWLRGLEYCRVLFSSSPHTAHRMTIYQRAARTTTTEKTTDACTCRSQTATRYNQSVKS